jgi:ATP-binding cassette, subfamily B, bacterial
MAVQGLLPLAWLYVVKLIVDQLSGSSPINANPADVFDSVAILLGVAFAIAFLTGLCSAVSGYATTALAHLVTDSVQQLVQAKSVTLDLEYYENPLAFDKLHRAQREAPGRPTQIARELAELTQHGLTLVGLLVLLARFHWGVVVVILLASLPLLVFRLRHSQSLYDWHRSVTMTERLGRYFNDILTTPGSAKELRVFGFEGVVRERFAAIRKQLRAAAFGLAAKRHQKEFLIGFGAALAGYGTIGFVAYRALEGTISIGDLVMYFGAFQIAMNSLRVTLTGLGNVYENNLFLSALAELLAVEKAVVEPSQPRAVPKPIREGLSVEHLTFRYPGTNRTVLDDVSMQIGRGQLVAFVGPNGSGKSTMIKLLARLYDPTHGRITLDGIDIKEFATKDFRGELSVIFQDYVHYQMSARDNIWLGMANAPANDARILDAARRAGIDDVLQRLQRGYDTVLSRSLADGEELSIGQWQRLSLARSLYRDAQVLIMDEPTASMDADAEHEFFDTFRASVGGRTAIVVSHRFTMARLADHIYVFDGGRIAEHGAHDELVGRRGLYARLFEHQAAPYQQAWNTGAVSRSGAEVSRADALNVGLGNLD